MAYRLLNEMRVDMYRKLDPLAPAYMVRRRSGDLVSIVGSDIETVEYFFAHTITPAFVAVVVPAGSAGSAGDNRLALGLDSLAFPDCCCCQSTHCPSPVGTVGYRG